MLLVRGAAIYHDGVAVKEEICRAISITDALHRDLTGRDAEVTSIVEGDHSERSLHYAGLAFDLRSWYLDDLVSFCNMLRTALGDKYDVVLEATHIHVEFQPKRT
jgi:hypothetical protein